VVDLVHRAEAAIHPEGRGRRDLSPSFAQARSTSSRSLSDECFEISPKSPSTAKSSWPPAIAVAAMRQSIPETFRPLPRHWFFRRAASNVVFRGGPNDGQRGDESAVQLRELLLRSHPAQDLDFSAIVALSGADTRPW
jgi:hypothetical protein